MESLISNVEAGQFWRLKNGDHARITSVSPLELMPICGMILERAEHALWTADGRATSNITVLSTDLDLDVQVTFVDETTASIIASALNGVTDINTTVSSLLARFDTVIEALSTTYVTATLDETTFNEMCSRPIPRKILPDRTACRTRRQHYQSHGVLIEDGQIWRTRAGRVVRILDTKVKSMRPILVHEHLARTYHLRSDGTMSQTGEPDARDLFELIGTANEKTFIAGTGRVHVVDSDKTTVFGQVPPVEVSIKEQSNNEENQSA